MSQADSIDTIRAAQHAARQLTDTEQQLRERHGSLVKELHHLRYGMNASEEEFRANIERLVDDERANRDRLTGGLACRALSGFSTPRTSLSGKGSEVRTPPHLPAIGDAVNGMALTFSDLCWLLPDQMKASLTSIVTTNGKFGLPRAERDARIAALETEIASVEREHAGLVTAAADVGISLPALPKQQG